MKVRTVISISVVALVFIVLPGEGFPKKKLLIGLGVKAHLGNVLLQNAARVAQLKQQLAENLLGTAVKHARTKADLLSVLLSATQALHSPPKAQYGDHNEDVTTSTETTEEITPPMGAPETTNTAPEHPQESMFTPPTESLDSQVIYAPPESSYSISSEIHTPSPPAPVPAYGPPPQAPALAYGQPEHASAPSYGPPAPLVSSFGIPNDPHGSASDTVSVSAPFTAVNVQRPHHAHYRHHNVQVNAPFVRLGVNSDAGVNLNVGK